MSTVAQISANALSTAAIYALVGVGFALIADTSRAFHFSHGAALTVGAYVCYWSYSGLGAPLWISIPLGLGGAALLGCGAELSIYAPLRRQAERPLAPLLASLGVYVATQNLLAVLFGNDTKSILPGDVQQSIKILGSRLTPVQITTISATAATVLVLGVMLAKTRFGKATRAVADDRMLARLSGIDCGRVVLTATLIGSGMAGAAGILLALDVGMNTTMGLRPFMMGVVAMMLGGRSSVIRTVLGALTLALAQHLVALAVGSEWQEGIAFAILLALLLTGRGTTSRQGRMRERL